MTVSPVTGIAGTEDVSVGSPTWWLRRLWVELQAEAPRYNRLFAYQGGNHPLPDGHKRAREAYKEFQKKARSNYVGLVTNSVVERLRPIGFRSGGATTNDLDATAWRIWQSNRFDARCKRLLLAACTASVAYVLVIPDPDDKTTPIWSVKDPRSTIVERDPVTGKARAGLTWWDDDTKGKRIVWVFLPDGVYEYIADIPKRATMKVTADQFEMSTTPAGDHVVRTNPSAPRIPIIAFVNRPDLDGDGMGEFEDVIDIQDRINAVTLDRLVISRMQAYRQRWVKGVQVEDENGAVQQPFKPGADLLWTVDAPDAAFGDFAATDLTPILKAAKEDIQDLAAISRTPPHYLMGQMVNVTGDGLQVAETGLTSKVGERQLDFGENFEDLIRESLALIGETLPPEAELIWGSAEYRTISELYDAASKGAAAGLPWRARMELLGKTPAEIERLAEQRIDDALLEAQYPQLEAPGTPVRYSANAIPGDATKGGQPELTGSSGAAGSGNQ